MAVSLDAGLGADGRVFGRRFEEEELELDGEARGAMEEDLSGRLLRATAELAEGYPDLAFWGVAALLGRLEWCVARAEEEALRPAPLTAAQASAERKAAAKAERAAGGGREGELACGCAAPGPAALPRRAPRETPGDLAVAWECVKHARKLLRLPLPYEDCRAFRQSDRLQADGHATGGGSNGAALAALAEKAAAGDGAAGPAGGAGAGRAAGRGAGDAVAPHDRFTGDKYENAKPFKMLWDGRRGGAGEDSSGARRSKGPGWRGGVTLETLLGEDAANTARPAPRPVAAAPRGCRPPWLPAAYYPAFLRRWREDARSLAPPPQRAADAPRQVRDLPDQSAQLQRLRLLAARVRPRPARPCAPTPRVPRPATLPCLPACAPAPRVSPLPWPPPRPAARRGAALRRGRRS
jgi:hypothetical protein